MDVHQDFELRQEICHMLDEYAKDLRKLAIEFGRTVWPPPAMQYDEVQASKLLTNSYAQDMIVMIEEVMESVRQ